MASSFPCARLSLFLRVRERSLCCGRGFVENKWLTWLSGEQVEGAFEFFHTVASVSRLARAAVGREAALG
jgi:hypothetical protein